MLKANFITADEAARKVKDGDTVCSIAMTLVSVSESILKALEKRFFGKRTSLYLTLLHSCGQSDRKDGIQHFAHEGMVTRIIGSHWGLQPRWMDMITKNQVDAYCLPQGQIAQLYHSMACGLPGKMAKVGLGTFIDPRIEGGKMNERTKRLPDIVDIIKYKDEEYMFYNQIPIDVCIIRGTECDEMGNLTTTEEAMKLEVLPAVMAAKRYGGRVIAQVKRVVQTGSLNPKEVTVPGVLLMILWSAKILWRNIVRHHLGILIHLIVGRQEYHKEIFQQRLLMKENLLRVEVQWNCIMEQLLILEQEFQMIW